MGGGHTWKLALSIGVQIKWFFTQWKDVEKGYNKFLPIQNNELSWVSCPCEKSGHKLFGKVPTIQMLSILKYFIFIILIPNWSTCLHTIFETFSCKYIRDLQI